VGGGAKSGPSEECLTNALCVMMVKADEKVWIWRWRRTSTREISNVVSEEFAYMKCPVPVRGPRYQYKQLLGGPRERLRDT
jgi:hypothetical protein